ncbi:MFS transporter, partial [Methylogaea oryzae]
MPPLDHPDDLENALFRKISRRLLPFLFLLYVVAYLDRVNIGFAKLQMNADLGFSDTVYGVGAGVFFLGYFLFEVPSGLILHRVGARRWIARVVAMWGLISAATLWVDTPASFYALRFLLGLGEAGFFPGIIYYLTLWYPSARRAQTVAVFMAAVPVAGVLGGPLSGWVMTALDGAQGLRGWQWLFLAEGLPAVLLGLFTWFWLDDGPAHARWLTREEKARLLACLARDEDGAARHTA